MGKQRGEKRKGPKESKANLSRMLEKSTWRWLKVEEAGEEVDQGGQLREEERLQSPFPSLLKAAFARWVPETFGMSVYQDDDY